MVRAVKEVWEEAVRPCNLPLTLLLGLAVLYWILNIVGAMDFDSADAAGADGDFHHDAGHSGWNILNAGPIPISVVGTLWILTTWIASILLNYYLNPQREVLHSGGFFFASAVLGWIATKILVRPLVPFMRGLKEAEDAAPVIGQKGVVRSIQLDARYGQVEVERPGGAPALLNARLADEGDPLPRGTPVIVVSIHEPTGIYQVAPSDSSSSLLI